MRTLFKYLFLASSLSVIVIILVYFWLDSKSDILRNTHPNEPIQKHIKTINQYGSEYLSQIKPASIESNNIKSSNAVTTPPGNLIASQIFNTSQEMLKAEVTYKYNKFKSPLSVLYRDFPYIDDITTENIPKLYPTLFKEKNYTSKTPLKKILMWNDAYNGNRHYGFGFGQDPFLLAKCPVNTCFTFRSRNMFPYTEWDAVVWHFRSNDRSLPKQRSNHTRYVWWMMESAIHLFGDLKSYNGIFNWTMNYRMDSDIYHPYGMVFKRHTITPQGPYVDYATNKTIMAAWFVSNCHAESGRNKLTESLQKHIQVDVYGQCGKFKCERKDQFTYCLQMLEKDYKFYLAFENALCRDDVTEKLFSVLQYNVIPVVYGFGNYSLQAPPHSYIDVLDYPNVAALADYLKYLDRNHTAYNEYFDWKREYISVGGFPKTARSWCKLCELLHMDNKPKVYTNLYKWYVTDSHCKSSSSQLISNFINGYK